MNQLQSDLIEEKIMWDEITSIYFLNQNDITEDIYNLLNSKITIFSETIISKFYKCDSQMSKHFFNCSKELLVNIIFSSLYSSDKINSFKNCYNILDKIVKREHFDIAPNSNNESVKKLIKSCFETQLKRPLNEANIIYSIVYMALAHYNLLFHQDIK